VSSLRLTLRMIKIEHTIFAMPFALLSLLLATAGRPSLRLLLWVAVAMVGARSSAMAFNRWADAAIDARNPRTSQREIPSGKLSRGYVLGFALASAVIFVVAAAQLNGLCLALSPVALAIIWTYSLTKRFTAISHLVLGLGLAIAPVGAWLAATGSFAVLPLLLAASVVCWVGGFDILYACQDEEFDRASGLHSVPAKLGVPAALWSARILHLLAVVAWFAATQQAGLGWLSLIGVLVAAALLLYEHWLVRGGDLRHIDRAFFEVNSYVGVALLLFLAGDLYLF